MKCPNCGKIVVENDLFCDTCGMRVRIEKGSRVRKTMTDMGNSRTETCDTFSQWRMRWNELFVENYESWSYLIKEHIDDENFDIPLMVCVYQFSTLIDMQNAYIALCTYGKDLGYGLPNDGVFMSKEDNRWYVLINCSDLPLVLFAAHCHHGELLGWIDYFIPMPPMQLHVAKSFDIATYQADFAPIRVKKQIANLQLFAQKQMSFPKFKQILGNVEKGRIWDHVK